MVVERGGNLPWYDGPTLLDLLETIEIDHDVNREDFRFPGAVGVPAGEHGTS